MFQKREYFERTRTVVSQIKFPFLFLLRTKGFLMTLGDIDIPLSVIATVLALLSFCGEAWRLWRDRPRLIFYVMPVTFTNVPKFGEMKMVRVMVCNVGYRPIVLTKFMAFGETSSFSMGIDDEPAAIFGKEDQRFPTLLQPGQTLKIHPTSPEIIERNAKKPDVEKTQDDPWKYFALVDSFGRLHPIDMDEVKFHLRLSTRLSRPKWWQKPSRWFIKKRFLRNARKRAAQRFF